MMDKGNVQALMKSLGKLNETVILKWTVDDIEMDGVVKKPENVHLRKWLPQQDLLAHSNIKAFYSHGGHYSFEESICYRKPMVSNNNCNCFD